MPTDSRLAKADEELLKYGTKSAKGQAFICCLTGAAIDRAYIQAEGKADRLGTRLNGNRRRAKAPENIRRSRQGDHNPKVGGSNPSPATTKINRENNVLGVAGPLR